MKHVKFLAVFGLAVSMLAGAFSATAAFPNEIVLNQDYQIMTRLSTYSGSRDFGKADGKLLTASYRTPAGILLMQDGTAMISDGKNQLIRKIRGGQVSTFAGSDQFTNDLGLPAGALLDGKGERCFFNDPDGLAADAQGNVYVADSGNHAIRKIIPDGEVVTLAGDGVSGLVDGSASQARFNTPRDVAAASDGTLYVADTLNHVIRKIAKDGTVSALTAPSERAVEVSPGEVVPAGDYRDGKLSEAKFNEPTGLAIDTKGNLYVSDSGNQRIRYIDLQAGIVRTVAGGSSNDDPSALFASNALYAEGGLSDGKASQAKFNDPRGIALTADGALVIADSLNHAVRYLANGDVYTLTGSRNGDHGYADGTEGKALLDYPTDVAVSPDGRILVVDAFNNAIRDLEFYRLPNELLNTKDRRNIDVVYNQKVLFAGGEVEFANNRAMIPVRKLAEKLGYQVQFEPAVQKVQIRKADTSLIFHVGNPDVIQKVEGADDRIFPFDTAPFVKNGIFYIPLRTVEKLGLDVQWHAQTRTVILRDALQLRSPASDYLLNLGRFRRGISIYHVRTGGAQVDVGVCIKCQTGTV